MKYCYNCDRITPGEPLFCNYCSRSYDVKLCPRRHANPRTAEACAQCGSRDLSTPQPRRPVWTVPLGFLLSLVPGVALAIGSALALIALFSAVVNHPEMIGTFLLLAVPFGIFWGMWSEIPSWFRHWVSRLLRRRRARHEGGEE